MSVLFCNHFHNFSLWQACGVVPGSFYAFSCTTFRSISLNKLDSTCFRWIFDVWSPTGQSQTFTASFGDLGSEFNMFRQWEPTTYCVLQPFVFCPVAKNSRDLCDIYRGKQSLGNLLADSLVETGIASSTIQTCLCLSEVNPAQTICTLFREDRA